MVYKPYRLNLLSQGILSRALFLLLVNSVIVKTHLNYYHLHKFAIIQMSQDLKKKFKHIGFLDFSMFQLVQVFLYNTREQDFTFPKILFLVKKFIEHKQFSKNYCLKSRVSSLNRPPIRK